MRPPTESRPSTLRSILTLALLCVALTACGDGPQGEPGVVRAASVASREWVTGESRLVTRLEVPEELEPWTYEAEFQRLETRPAEEGGQRVVALGSRVAKTLQIPLDGVPDFNQVACKLILRKNSSVSVDLLSEGRVLMRTPYSLVIASRHPQEIRIDLPEARALPLEPDALVLRFAGGARWAQCWDIELHERPYESWAADFASGRGRPVVGETAREGAAIASDNPRSMEFTVPAKGRMSFHIAPAPGLSISDHSARVAVRVVGPNGVREGEWPLVKGKRKDFAWQPAQLDLSSLAGQAVRAEFALVTDARDIDYALLSTPTIYTPVETPRTVIFITSDTHRADHIASAKGGVDVRTPALDALSARGVTFDDCFSSTNITVPSHVALLTAVSPRDTGVLDNMSGVAEEARTMADSFRASGWATLAAASGSQLQDAWSGLGQGFDAMACPSSMTWDGAETHERLAAMIESKSDRNLFIWLHLFDVHRPYDEESPYLSLYYPEGKDPYDPALPDPIFPRGSMDQDMDTLRDADYMDAGYKAEVTYTDEILSRVFEIPRIGDGVIAFTADHGECLGEYAIWWDHAGLYPENLRVPMIIAGPGVPAGRRVAGPVEHLDIGRTLLDLAGLVDVDFPGETMLRHVDVEPARDTPRFALASEGFSASVEMGGWMCIFQIGGWRVRGMSESKVEHSVELYDLRPGGDPQRDVAHEHVERAGRMRSMIVRWLEQRQPTGWVEQDQANDAVRIDQVRALGYTANATETGAIWIDPACDCEYCELFGE
jgi:arylsulfatase A-like enzyme